MTSVVGHIEKKTGQTDFLLHIPSIFILLHIKKAAQYMHYNMHIRFCLL